MYAGKLVRCGALRERKKSMLYERTAISKETQKKGKKRIEIFQFNEVQKERSHEKCGLRLFLSGKEVR